MPAFGGASLREIYQVGTYEPLRLRCILKERLYIQPPFHCSKALLPARPKERLVVCDRASEACILT